MINIHCLRTAVFIAGIISGLTSSAEQIDIKLKINPFNKNGMISYKVPESAPQTVIVQGQYQILPDGAWYPLAIRKYRSHTAENILSLDRKQDLMTEELSTGKVTELLAAGRVRTLVWQTYPDLPADFSGKIHIKLSICDLAGKKLAQASLMQNLNLKDLIILNDFTKLRPASNISDEKNSSPGWHYIKSFNKRVPGHLEAIEGKNKIDSVIFRPELKGYYALFVSVPAKPVSSIQLRLSSDFYGQRFDGCDGREYFWKVAQMDNEHIVIMQPAWTTKKVNDAFRARLRYLKLVKLTKQQYDDFNQQKNYRRDKKTVGFFEPYSWAFHEKVDNNEQFMQAVAAFKEARIDYIDMQLGRLGARPIYPSTVEPPLLGKTHGDGAPGGKSPISTTVARLPLFTNPTKGLIAASRAMQIASGIHFGAGINYAGSPAEGEFSKNHPEWCKEKYFLQYKFKEVRRHLLNLYEENLKMGIKNISLDYGRYPRVVDKPEYATLFLKELRDLADKYSTPEKKIKIMVRFPVKGVRYERDNFFPEEWIKLKLVDTIIASGLFANIQYFDARRYVKMTRNTGITCLVDIDGGNGYHPWPGAILERVKDIYSRGADGIYIYQSDARIVGSMNRGLSAEDKHFIAKLGSSRAVNEMIEEAKEKNKIYSSGIYIFYPVTYQSYRIKVWLEGLSPDIVEFYVNGELVNRYTDKRQLYIVGKEEYENNYKFINKPVVLKIRVKINGKWIEKIHKIKRIFHSFS